MKKTLLIALLLVNSAFAEQLTGFMGIPFGASKSELKAFYRTKQPESQIYSEDVRSIIFTNVTFGGRQTEGIVFGLTDSSKFHTAAALIKPAFESDIFDLYYKIVGEINIKYHYRDSQTESWKYPYDENDKYTHGTTAIKMNKGTLQTLWYFPVENGEKNVIEVTITDALWVKICYQNGNMINDVVVKDIMKNSADY